MNRTEFPVQSRLFLVLWLGLLVALPVRADQTPPNVRDTRDLETFVDGVLNAQQRAHHFAGAVVVVVSDGEIALEKGYGFADFAARAPVDPRRTLFRVASNSKMFVWTAVMQLVEQGKLDLRRDVNHYLKGFQIPATFPESITLEHLMTHTAGFEDRIVGLFRKSPDGLRPLAELMQRDMPARIFAPGRIAAYSNYGSALAALIVEQVSGMPYDTYLEERLLVPLQMRHATIEQPVPDPLAADLSKGYAWADGRLQEQPFEYVPWAPIGGMSISGEDMGRFMIAHLNDGVLGGARILRAETARAMREKLVSFSPNINGMLHGFMEQNSNGEFIYGHVGDTVWFHSLTAMIPSKRLGVFIAYNTDTGSVAREQFSQAFLDRYFPETLGKEPVIAKSTVAKLDRFTGLYATSRVSEKDVTKILKLAGLSVSVDRDGYLVMRGGDGVGGAGVTRWRQIEPLVFAQLDGHRRLAFRENDRGDIADLCTTPICAVEMIRQPWWKGRIPQFTWLGLSVAILVAAIIGFPIAGVLQRKIPKPRGAKLTRLAAWVTSVVLLSGVGSTLAGITDANALLFGTPPFSLRAGLTLLVVGAVLSVVLGALTIAAWSRRWWHAAGRVCVSLVLLGAGGLVVWLFQWNLLGWQY